MSVLQTGGVEFERCGHFKRQMESNEILLSCFMGNVGSSVSRAKGQEISASAAYILIIHFLKCLL